MAPKKAEGKKTEEEGPRVYVKIDVSWSGPLLVGLGQLTFSLHLIACNNLAKLMVCCSQRQDPACSLTHSRAKLSPCNQIHQAQTGFLLERSSARLSASQAGACTGALKS